MSDMVNKPAHYNHGKYEVIDVIEDWKLGYHLGNAVKYIARCEHKGSRLQDLQKARWYLARAIENEEKAVKLAEAEMIGQGWEKTVDDGNNAFWFRPYRYDL